MTHKTPAPLFTQIPLIIFVAKQPPKPACKALVDIGFLIDSSGSMKENYRHEKSFLKEIATAFSIGDRRSSIGVATFSEYPQYNIKLNDHDTLLGFNKAVDDIPFLGKISKRTDRALQLVLDDMFSIRNGGRAAVPKIVILITDGSQTHTADSKDTAKIANKIRSRGISLLAIGIGGRVNTKELDEIAGGDSFAFLPRSFDKLIGKKFTDDFKGLACAIGKPDNTI